MQTFLYMMLHVLKKKKKRLPQTLFRQDSSFLTFIFFAGGRKISTVNEVVQEEQEQYKLTCFYIMSMDLHLFLLDVTQSGQLEEIVVTNDLPPSLSSSFFSTKPETLIYQAVKIVAGMDVQSRCTRVWCPVLANIQVLFPAPPSAQLGLI